MTVLGAFVTHGTLVAVTTDRGNVSTRILNPENISGINRRLLNVSGAVNRQMISLVEPLLKENRD